MQGWVSIHRKIKNNPVWQDPKLLKLWMLCLLEASHKEHEQLVGRQIVKLHPGEFVTGRYALAKAFNDGAKKSDLVPESTIWRWLKWLEKNDFLAIKSTTKFSIISIKNWNVYQQNEQKSEQQKSKNNHYISSDSESLSFENEQQMNNKWTANEQQMNTNNNGNKGNNENKDKDDDKMQPNYFAEYEKAFGYPPALLQSDFEYWIDDHKSQFVDPEEIIIEVIHRARKQMPRNPAKYVSKILRDLHEMELYTLDAVKAYNQKFDEKFSNGGVNNGAKVYQYGGNNGGPTKENREPILGDFVGRVPPRRKQV